MEVPSREDHVAPSHSPLHVPVMVNEVATALAPCITRTWVDCTTGMGGHARALFNVVSPAARLIAMDVDPNALRCARETLAEFAERVRYFQGNFEHIADAMRAVDKTVDLAPAGCGNDDDGAGSAPTVDAILADLGVNSAQLDQPGLGLSFDRDEPLDMRLDPEIRTSAADLINSLDESELADLLYLQADERHSRKIARRICRERRAARITGTARLARIVASAIGGGRGRIHPATRTFMALRIAVNREDQALAALLDAAPRLLRPGGRIAIISFHSGEDRRVKEDFRRRAKDGIYCLITRRPLTPGSMEQAANPRARSAKLRVAERLAMPAAE